MSGYIGKGKSVALIDGMVGANNLSDVDSAATSLTNLGITSTAAELNYLDITALGTTEASKAVTTDASGDVVVNEGNLSVYQGTGTSQFQVGASSNYYWDISRDNVVTGDLIISNKNGGSVTGRMRINSSGNIFAPYNSTTTSLVVGGDGTTSNLGARVCVKSPISAGVSQNYAININDPNTNTAGGQNLIAFSHNGEDYSAANVRASLGATIDGSGAGSLVFRTGGYGSQAERMRIDSSGNLAVTGGSVSDEYGNVRDVPAVGTKTTAYTLQSADAGRYVQTSSGATITIPNLVFSQGDVVTILNAHTSDSTITCSTTYSFITGDTTNKPSVTLAARGICTLLFTTGNTVFMSGNLS